MGSHSHGSHAMAHGHDANLSHDLRAASADDFYGHFVPAVYLFTTGLWWTIGAYIRYYSCLRSGATFQSSLWYPFRSGNYPVESIFRILLSTINIIGIVYGRIKWGDYEQYSYIKLESMYHNTAFATFLLVDVFILMRFKGYQSPLSVEYWCLALALMNTAILFLYHTHANDLVNLRTHKLLVMILFSLVAVVVAEMRHRNSIQLALTRGYLLLVCGTWVLHVGIILNPMPGMKYWAKDSHEDSMLVTLMFAWHCIVNFVVILVIGRLVLWIGFNDDVEPKKDHELSFNKDDRLVVNGNGGQSYETDKSELESMNGYSVEYRT